ncbi:MAG: ABC-F family ATP-binding cassette domain-containing protein, partial [Terrisporobacter othiniensis]|nr:ABC-F family ATP-binding cassette domain-containing protein [Terrisporobacter othiniensis]
TNHLDFQSINWLNNFIMDLEDSIVIVVSHDRHFLNQICTNIVDVDFGKIQMYVGNYDFWYESSQLALQLQKDQNKKTEEKVAQLKEFIARFSSNASKAKQATSRKKQLDKLQIEDIQPSRRRYPYVGFTPEREIGNEVLEVEGLTKIVDGVKVLDNVSFRLDKEDKVAFMGDEIAITTLFNILMGEETADAGTFKWGVTTSQSYLPKNHNNFFEGCEYSLVDWLRQFSEEKSESFIRGFLGRMLFSGEEALKQAHVLSGGEKVRCMLSKLMLSNSNVLVLDDPTNHLDLESITSVNKGLEKFSGVMLFSSHDHEMIQTLANRIIEITPGGIMDRKTTLEEYLENKDIQKQLKEMYAVER